ncbi:uncharacterized protein ATC70_013341 [Mucor velutinosus]|uniref:Uncharacterized protein n=1 Tax=Mucor velutinosus TaxID=708070 RepID=A0AAN7D8C6_9FUNG|nr:hypothetical protein ATC70_013341 [Mucor velutinosus]
MEDVLADTNILVKEYVCDVESPSSRTLPDICNEMRGCIIDSNSYTFGWKNDLILKDSDNNELNTGGFKRKNVCNSVKVSKKIQNIRDYPALLIESKKSTQSNIAEDGIDNIGDRRYIHEAIYYQDVIGVEMEHTTHFGLPEAFWRYIE